MVSLVAARIRLDDTLQNLLTFSIQYPSSDSSALEAQSSDIYLQSTPSDAPVLFTAHSNLQTDTERKKNERSTETAQFEEVQRENELLRNEVCRLQAELLTREDTIKKQNGAIRDRDSRKKGAEMMLAAVEKRNKELITEAVRREREEIDWKKRTAEINAEMKSCKETLANQTDLLRKRDDQIQFLLSQLKRKEFDISRLSKDISKKSSDLQSLQIHLKTTVEQTERETRLKASKEMEEIRGVVAAKEGEMRLVKEMVKSYHSQLRLKEGAVREIKRKVAAVKLPPIDVRMNRGEGSPTVISAKTKPVTTERKQGKVAVVLSTRSETEDLEDLFRRSQPAFAGTGVKPIRQKRATQSMDANVQGSKKEEIGAGIEIKRGGSVEIIEESKNEENTTLPSPLSTLPPSQITSQYNADGQLELVDLSAHPKTPPSSIPLQTVESPLNAPISQPMFNSDDEDSEIKRKIATPSSRKSSKSESSESRESSSSKKGERPKGSDSD